MSSAGRHFQKKEEIFKNKVDAGIKYIKLNLPTQSYFDYTVNL